MKSLTFSTTLDSGYLVPWPTTQAEGKRISPVFRLGAKRAHTSHTSVVVTVDPEVDKTTQQEQQEEQATRDSSRNACDGGSAQAAIYLQQVRQLYALTFKSYSAKQSDLPGPILRTFEGSPSVRRALGITRNQYVRLGLRWKTSALRALPGFCWMVWNIFEVLRSWMPRWYLLRRPGPFIWMSKPSENMGLCRHCLIKNQTSVVCNLHFKCVFSKHFTAQSNCSHLTVFTPVSALLSFCFQQGVCISCFSEMYKLITRILGWCVML